MASIFETIAQKAKGITPQFLKEDEGIAGTPSAVQARERAGAVLGSAGRLGEEAREKFGKPLVRIAEAIPPKAFGVFEAISRVAGGIAQRTSVFAVPEEEREPFVPQEGETLMEVIRRQPFLSEVVEKGIKKTPLGAIPFVAPVAGFLSEFLLPPYGGRGASFVDDIAKFTSKAEVKGVLFKGFKGITEKEADNLAVELAPITDKKVIQQKLESFARDKKTGFIPEAEEQFRLRREAEISRGRKLNTEAIKEEVKAIISKTGGDKTRMKPFGNIADDYVNELGEKIYSSEGFLQEKYQLHIKELTAEEFSRLPEVTETPEFVKIDPRPKNEGTVIFIKNIDGNLMAVVQARSEVGRLTLFKTEFMPKEKIQKFLDFPDLPKGGRAPLHKPPRPSARPSAALSDLQREIAPIISEPPKAVKPTPKLTPDEVERRFITRAKEELPEAQKIAGQYIPRSTDDLAIKARNLITDDVGAAERLALEGTDEKAVATASELLKHYSRQADAAADLATKNAIYDKAAEVANNIAEKLTSQGRSVQAASILGRLTPEGQVRFAAREIQKWNLKNPRAKVPELTGQQAQRISDEMKIINAMPPGEAKAIRFQQLQKEIQKLMPSRWWQKVIAVWKAGLLTGIKTSGLNIFSNTSHATGAEIIKDVPATVADILLSLVTGKRTKTFTLKGLTMGIKEGAQKGWRYLTTGFDERDIAKKLDYKQTNFKNKAVQKQFGLSDADLKNVTRKDNGGTRRKIKNPLIIGDQWADTGESKGFSFSAY